MGRRGFNSGRRGHGYFESRLPWCPDALDLLGDGILPEAVMALSLQALKEAKKALHKECANKFGCRECPNLVQLQPGAEIPQIA